jgi:hypothetical protein
MNTWYTWSRYNLRAQDHKMPGQQKWIYNVNFLFYNWLTQGSCQYVIGHIKWYPAFPCPSCPARRDFSAREALRRREP